MFGVTQPAAAFPISRISTFRGMYDGLPFGGSFNDTRFMTAEGPFNPGITIRWVPLKDLSLPQPYKDRTWDDLVDSVRMNIKVGDDIKAVAMTKTNEEHATVEGKIHMINLDHSNHIVSVIVRNSANNELVEVHPETIFRDINSIKESKLHHIKSFDNF